MATPEGNAGPTILVPRPYREHDRFAAGLIRLGWTVLRYPVIELRTLGDSSGTEYITATLAGARHIIFVSARAAQSALDALHPPAPDIAATAALYAVGDATAEVLRAAGFPVIAPAHGATSEALLALPGLAEVRGERIVICRGRGGRDKLRQELACRGADVRYLDLYERRASTAWAEQLNRSITAGQVNAVAIHSGAIMDALWQQLDSGARRCLKTLPVLVPGERVAALVRRRGMEKLLVADSALPENMVALLDRWYTEKGL